MDAEALDVEIQEAPLFQLMINVDNSLELDLQERKFPAVRALKCLSASSPPYPSFDASHVSRVQAYITCKDWGKKCFSKSQLSFTEGHACREWS